MLCVFFFFFKQKTAYEMRISDWSSDVCSSDLPAQQRDRGQQRDRDQVLEQQDGECQAPVVGVELLALGQQLQADRGGRQRQAQADHPRPFPVQVRGQIHHRPQRQRAPCHLQPPGNQTPPPHNPPPPPPPTHPP